MAADVVVGAAHELDHVGRHARLVDVAHQLDGRGDGLGRRLEQDRVAGGEGGDDAVGRDRDREVPRSGDEHDAERVGGHAVGGELVERPCVLAAAQRAKSTASDTSGSPSRTVLPVSWAITAIVRPRLAAMTSATRASARRRSLVVVVRHWAAPARARATSSSMPSVVVTSGGSSAGWSFARCSAIHSRLPASGEVGVGLVGERLIGIEAADLGAADPGPGGARSTPSARRATAASKRCCSACHTADPGVIVNSDRRKFSGPEFSSSRRDR